MMVTRRLRLLAEADANSTSMFGKMLEMNGCVAKQVAAQRLRKPNTVHLLQVGQFKGSAGSSLGIGKRRTSPSQPRIWYGTGSSGLRDA
jgi:hypothetical protein